MSQRARRSPKKPTSKTENPPSSATPSEPTTTSLPAATDRADWAIAAARNAVTVAAGTDANSHRPVPVLGAFQLDTGLVDYGMWIEMFTRAAPPPKPEQPYRRGRIWA